MADKILGNPLIKELLARGAEPSEILHYAEIYRGKRVVVKIGAVQEHTGLLKQKIAQNVLFVKNEIGAHPVIVHGGGKYITDAIQADNPDYEPDFVDGDRYTDKDIMNAVYNELSKITRGIVDLFNEYNTEKLNVVELGTNPQNAVLIARCKDQKRKGLVGRVINLEYSFLKLLQDKNTLPVVCPVGYTSENKYKRNVNADDAAAEIAYRISAQGLFYLTNIEGVMDNGHCISEMTIAEAKEIHPNLGTGMDRKVEASIMAVKKNVEAAYIFDGNMINSLLTQMLTNEGIGTKIRK